MSEESGQQEAKLRVRWVDAGVEPRCPPDPHYPRGKPMIMANLDGPYCYTDLPYPAPRVGRFVIECLRCGLRAMLTTAGRADDPCSVSLPCKKH